MKKLFLYIFSILMFVSAKTYGQYGENDFTISVNYNYTTTSKLFLFPKSPDEITRNQSIDFDDVKSVSAEFRYKVADYLTLGLSVEQFEKKQKRFDSRVTGFLVNIEDGFKIYPVQLTAYYTLPFSTELFKFYMGGGFGIYFGEHTRDFSNVSVNDNGSTTEFGIHIKTGFDYMIEDFFSIRGEMNFRDPEVDLSSSYNSDTFEHQGQTLLLPRRDFDTKVNIDGATFSIGAVLHF